MMQQVGHKLDLLATTVRASASRLLATNSAVDNQQHHVFPTGDSSGISSQPLGVWPADVAIPSSSIDGWHGATQTAPADVWPMPSAFGNLSSLNCENRWVDTAVRRAVQAATLTPSQADLPLQDANCPPTASMVLLQPMLLPVFRTVGAHSCTAAGAMFPPSVMAPIMQQCAAPLVHAKQTPEDGVADMANSQPQLGAATPTRDSGRSRRQRRSKRDGMAAKQGKSSGAIVEEADFTASTATPETTSDPEFREDSQQILATPTVLDPLPRSQTRERWADMALDVDLDEECRQELEASSLPSPMTSSVDESESLGLDVDALALRLSSDDEEMRRLALDSVLTSFWPLAVSKKGCRVVQKAFDVGSPAVQQQLAENLSGRVQEAWRSPHANYILQKCIEVMPPEQMQFVLAELQGEACVAARHRFGCRILQRLVEHCPTWQTEVLVGEVLSDASALCRHQYGNFVIQHILQHGSTAQRSAIADVICEDIMRLSKHRIASNVVSCAVVHCAPADVQRMTQVVLSDAGQLADLSRREYGSFVVREVHRAARHLRA